MLFRSHRLKWTQAGLAAYLDVSTAAVSNWEAGIRTPSLDAALSILSLARDKRVRLTLEEVFKAPAPAGDVAR